MCHVLHCSCNVNAAVADSLHCRMICGTDHTAYYTNLYHMKGPMKKWTKSTFGPMCFWSQCSTATKKHIGLSLVHFSVGNCKGWPRKRRSQRRMAQ